MNRNMGEVASSRTNVVLAAAAVTLEARTHAAAETKTRRVSLRNMVPPGVDAGSLDVYRTDDEADRSSFGRDRLRQVEKAASATLGPSTGG
jgi:hypothetical protein